jgi:hypothetical protein
MAASFRAEWRTSTGFAPATIASVAAAWSVTATRSEPESWWRDTHGDRSQDDYDRGSANKPMVAHGLISLHGTFDHNGHEFLATKGMRATFPNSYSTPTHRHRHGRSTPLIQPPMTCSAKVVISQLLADNITLLLKRHGFSHRLVS